MKTKPSTNPKNALTRGQVAKLAGVGIETIRFYEREGLLPEPPRRESGYRQYALDAVMQIRFIRRAQELGFSLKEISELLSLKLNPKASCADIKSRADTKIKSIEEKIKDLQRMKKALIKLASACVARGPITECAIIDAFEERESDHASR